ncbi:hypothetical protein M5K25_000524 [Dendrobium thyrsiflorum]|uniref:Uncharacterized protein n=1 Tax=Dendrobium thyrsiflorum TaxID=117978 RepID=A0ABD0VU68_DENTH
MDGRFAVLEEMMRKMLEDKQKPATLESMETTDGYGRGGNPNPFRGRENPEVEVLEGDDGMPPLEPLSREEMSMGYDRRGADFVGRMEEFYRRGADFEGRRGEYDEGFRLLTRFKKKLTKAALCFLLNIDRKPPGVGRGRGRGREDGSSTHSKGIGRGSNDNKVSGSGRGRGGPGGRGGGRAAAFRAGKEEFAEFFLRSEKYSSNFGFLEMTAKKVDVLEERLEGEMNQIKETVEERMSSMEGQVADLRDMMKKMLEFQTQSAASDAKGPEAKNTNSEIHREEEEGYIFCTLAGKQFDRKSLGSSVSYPKLKRTNANTAVYSRKTAQNREKTVKIERKLEKNSSKGLDSTSRSKKTMKDTSSFNSRGRNNSPNL